MRNRRKSIIKHTRFARSGRRIFSAAVACAAILFISAAIDALTLPSQGYIVYVLSDGSIYRRMLNEAQPVKIVNQGYSPSINPKNGGLILFIENSGSGRRAVLTDVNGASRRVVGTAILSGMSNATWTDRGDRFTFSYSSKWAIMDTLGNYADIPVPAQMVEMNPPNEISCSSDPKKHLMSAQGFSAFDIRGNLIHWDMTAAGQNAQFGHIDQDNPASGIPQSSQLAPAWYNNGCYNTFSPNGEAYAHHSGGHGTVTIHNLTTKSDGTICAGDSYNLSEYRTSSQDYSSYGIAWSNEYQWMVVRSEKDHSWNIVHLPPFGSTTAPDNPAYVTFQSYGNDPLYRGVIDMWVGPFTTTTMAAAPVISSTATAVPDSVVVTIASSDAQASMYYTLDGSDPTQQSTRYSQPFGLHIAADSVVVKARAYKTGAEPSSVTRHVAYVIDADAITRIRYYPRTGWASRMVGGIFEGSNGDKDAGPYSAIYTISSQPADGQWTEAAVPATTNTAYRFVRYRAGGNCNVAEIEFYRGAAKAAGTPIGTPGAWTSGMDYTRAWDGDVATFFDYLQTNGGYTGLDLDSTADPSPQITILSPVAGTIYHLGDTMKIRWTYSPGSAVRVMCSRNGGQAYQFEVPPVNCGADGSGSFAWILTASDTAMVSAQAKVAVADYSDPNIRGISGAFTIGRPGATAGNRASLPPAGEGFVIWGNSITFNKAAGGPIPLVTITGVNGRSHEPRMVRAGSLARWDLGKLVPGMYVINIQTPEKTFTRRIAVQK